MTMRTSGPPRHRRGGHVPDQIAARLDQASPTVSHHDQPAGLARLHRARARRRRRPRAPPDAHQERLDHARALQARDRERARGRRSAHRQDVVRTQGAREVPEDRAPRRPSACPTTAPRSRSSSGRGAVVEEARAALAGPAGRLRSRATITRCCAARSSHSRGLVARSLRSTPSADRHPVRGALPPIGSLGRFDDSFPAPSRMATSPTDEVPPLESMASTRASAGAPRPSPHRSRIAREGTRSCPRQPRPVARRRGDRRRSREVGVADEVVRGAPGRDAGRPAGDERDAVAASRRCSCGRARTSGAWSFWPGLGPSSLVKIRSVWSRKPSVGEGIGDPADAPVHERVHVARALRRSFPGRSPAATTGCGRGQGDQEERVVRPVRQVAIDEGDHLLDVVDVDASEVGPARRRPGKNPGDRSSSTLEGIDGVPTVRRSR